MDLEHFYSLTCDEQLSVLEECGVLVGERENEHHNMFLYHVQAFYVEVAKLKEDGTLWRIAPFDHPIFLEPYLNQIDLGTLLS